MEPFTLNQAIVAGLLFLLGLLIGMFLFAGRKWKGRYLAEAARADELERENARLGAEVREYESLRHAADRAPVVAPASVETRAPVSTPLNKGATRVGPTTTTTVVTPEPYRRVDTTGEAKPDVVIRRP